MSGPELRYRFEWLLVGYAMVAVVIYLSLTSEPPDIDIDMPLQDKIFHALAYFSLMLWFAQIYHARRQVYIFAAGFVAMGVVLELIQSLDPARYTEFGDMIANTIGVALALGLSTTPLKNVLVSVEKYVHS